MKITISSDNHLGTKRQAHTTRESSERLRQMLYAQSIYATRDREARHYNAGDLLDRANNDEATLLQAYHVGKRYSAVLAGNHDERNQAGAVTTLRALDAVGVPVVCSPDLSTPYYEQIDSFLFMVPHHASQELFMQALQEVSEVAHELDHPTYLILHCNYDWPEINPLSDNTLNLSAEDAETLLHTFNRIFIGHEHQSKTAFNDRLILTGNLFPTSFSDIGDKFIWHLDPDADTLEKECICAESTIYREIKYGDPLPDLSGVKFVDVIGATGAENAVDVANFVRSVWGDNDTLCAVRNKVEMNDGLAGIDIDAETPTLVDLSGRIRADLKDSDLLPLYNRLESAASE